MWTVYHNPTRHGVVTSTQVSLITTMLYYCIMGFEPQAESKSVYQGVSGLDAGKQVFNDFSVGGKIMCLGFGRRVEPIPAPKPCDFYTNFPPERKRHFGPRGCLELVHICRVTPLVEWGIL